MTDRFAPTAEEIEAIARAAMARMPDAFRAHLEGVMLRIEEFADDDVLEELGIEDPFDLTGLYQGIAIGAKESGAVAPTPDMIHLFRRPLLEEWIETGVGLEALVAHVLIHEVGHHFGLSDGDMHALEDDS